MGGNRPIHFFQQQLQLALFCVLRLGAFAGMVEADSPAEPTKSHPR